jgi:hypothetical protein
LDFEQLTPSIEVPTIDVEQPGFFLWHPGVSSMLPASLFE